MYPGLTIPFYSIIATTTPIATAMKLVPILLAAPVNGTVVGKVPPVVPDTLPLGAELPPGPAGTVSLPAGLLSTGRGALGTALIIGEASPGDEPTPLDEPAGRAV